MPIARLIANGLAPLTLLGAILAWLEPALFSWLKPYISWLFGATMFALGAVLKPEELGDTLRRPQRIAAGVLVQYTVMPLLGLAVALLFELPPALALGFIIVGCAPGAMASNVIVYLSGGVVAFSIALTTVATLLSPLLTPALVELLGERFLPVDFVKLMEFIVYTVLLPLLAGIALRHYRPGTGRHADGLAPAVAALSIVLICSALVALNADKITTVGPTVLSLVVVVNLLGYLLGYLAALLFRFDGPHQLTLSIEIGMQNAGLGASLAAAHFSAEAALPGALFAVWSVLSSAVVAAWLRRRYHRQALLTP